MHLSDHSLDQLDEAYVQTLDEGALRGLSLRLLEDLKEARERLRQNPNNSSRPPSSRAPWERPSAGDEEMIETADADALTAMQDDELPDEATLPPEDSSGTPETPAHAGRATEKPRRQAGKQPGAPGFGRTQVFTAQETLHHRPSACAACAAALPGDAPSVG